MKISSLSTSDNHHKARQPSAKLRGEHTASKAVQQNGSESQTLKESSLAAMKQSSQPNSSQFTIQSPPNSHQNQERKPLFEHGRTSRTKNGKSSIYPALAQGGVSQNSEINKLPDTSADFSAAAGPQSEIQKTSGKQITGSLIPSLVSGPDQSKTVVQSSNTAATFTKSVAPKFLPAGSIKMQQAVKASQSKKTTSTTLHH